MTGKREIVFDTETTGFEAWGDDRITEIGAIEIIDLLPTGRSFHCYCHPRRDISERVTQITGITIKMLEGLGAKDFKDNAQDFLDFIGGDPLVAHNADFDRNFINAELERAGFDRIPAKRFTDTLKIARAKFPGSPASLDALCRRFDISLAGRDTHGAIIDSELLAAVYLELSGGRAHVMDFGGAAPAAVKTDRPVAEQRPARLAQLSTPQEREAHTAFVSKMGHSAVWARYGSLE
jgi:DNA polymerase-3 subunit epsilon